MRTCGRKISLTFKEPITTAADFFHCFYVRNFEEVEGGHILFGLSICPIVRSSRFGYVS